MSSSIRFLGVAILAWAAVRAVSLGIIPGTQALAFDARADQPASPALPPIEPSALPPIEPVAVAAPGYQPAPPPHQLMGYGAPAAAYGAYPVYIPVPATSGRSAPPQIIYVTPPPADPREVHIYGDPLPGTSHEATKMAMLEPVPAPTSGRQTTPSFTDTPGSRPKWRDNLSISSWAMMRNRAGTDSLASGGQLGASQAGARLMWRFTPNLAASLRASAPVNSQRGAEAALGLRYQPFIDIPVAVTLERRHRFREYGQNAFAAFAEGGVYGRSMPWNSTLDGYFQAGIVDFNNPDWFVDGQAAVTRPIWRNLSAGFGVWGGAQPGLHRLDVGPRASLRIGNRVRAHVDYRYMLTGNAQPGSGAVVTLAGDF